MNLDDRILVLENRGIDFLTMFTWWYEVRFDITNVRLATIISTLSSLFGFVSFFIISQDLYEKKQLVFFFIVSIITSFFVVGFLIKVLITDLFEKMIINENPQGSPNPCRVSRRHSASRRSEAFFTLLLLVNLNSDVILFFLFLFYFSRFLISFLLACDSISPEEKNRRRKLNEVNSFCMQLH